jgi:predicted DNA-binding transcriptional regulator AlpA
LIDANETAGLLGISRYTLLQKWSRRPGFPEPYDDGYRYLWDPRAINAWKAENRVQRRTLAARETAELLGIEVRSLYSYMGKPGFPEPVRRRDRRLFFDAHEVALWRAQHPARRRPA